MAAAGLDAIAGQLRRHPILAFAGVGVLALIVWSALPDRPHGVVGAACTANDICQSGICLPDASPAEVDAFAELIQAYEQGRNANPGMVGEIEELLKKLPRSSLTLHPKYPGVCTDRCTSDPDCPAGMFCMEAVWTGVIKGIDRGRIQVCMPDDHPAARLMR